jgi:hypothetical protein
MKKERAKKERIQELRSDRNEEKEGRNRRKREEHSKKE